MTRRTMTVGELKPQFSTVLDEVRAGHEIIVSYGRRKEKVAVLSPYGRRRSGGSARDTAARPPARIDHRLDRFIGTWCDDPAFDQAVAEFDRVDPELWR